MMNLKKYFACCFVLILLVSLTAYGEINLSKTSMISSRPTIAVNQNGVILVVWTDSEFSDEAGMIWYNVHKNGVWEGPKDAKISRQRCWSPQLDIDSKGNFHLAYADGNSRLNREIYHCVYNPESGWSNPEMIYNSPENSAWAKLQVLDDVIYIAWYHENAPPYEGSDTVLHYKGVEDEAWPESYLRITYTANQVSIHPAFRIKDGRVYVCNMGKETSSVPWRIFYKEDQLEGGSWHYFKAEQIVPTGYYPELAVDDNGNVHIIYSNRSGNFYYKSKVGDIWKGNEVISNGFARLQFGDLKYKNHLLVAAWVEKINEATFLYYSKKIIGGDWELPVQISSAKEARMPKIWMDDKGNGYFVWVDKSWAHERDVFYEKIALPLPRPFLQLSEDSLSFTLEGDAPDPATFSVKNIGEGSLTYNISTESWLSVTPANGTLGYKEEVEIQAEIADLTLDEGTYTGIIEVSSPQAINSPIQVEVQLEVLVPPIFPALNFTGEVKENRALFFREYIHDLSWGANPLNRNIVKYKLYEIDGGNHIFLQEFSSSTFKYMRRNVEKDRAYTYELYAVDDKDRIGTIPAVLVIE